MGRKKVYLPPDTVELEGEFSPSAPFSTGTIPRHGNKPPNKSNHFLRHSGGVQEDDVTPSAPPLDLMDQVSGYESTSFDAVCVPPPPGMKRKGGGAMAREAGGEEEEAEEEEVEEEAAAEDEEEAAATAAAAAAAEDKEDEEDEEEEEEREEREEEGLVGQKERAEGEERDEEEEESSTRGGGVVLADTLPVVSEQEARTALLNLVAEHCCWGKAAARNMNITKIASTSAFHYEMQTFTEKRETSWAFMPHSGGEIDGPRYGTAPRPWDIVAEPTDIFRNEIKVLQVPHTASVKQCHRCRGAGSLLCQECHGKGWTRCLSCHGDGWGSDSAGNKERCFFCQSSTHGRGRQDCLKCNAKGRVACPPCDSYGQIRCYISLTISWKANTSEHIVEKSSLPADLIRQVSGQVVYEEEGARIAPLLHFPDPTISLASAQLLLNHNRQWPDKKMLAQRQQVRMVPVTEILYTWKRRSGRFYLYGYENKVHAPEYPQTCCWGCSIL